VGTAAATAIGDIPASAAPVKASKKSGRRIES
jgi:hypothetical protein